MFYNVQFDEILLPQLDFFVGGRYFLLISFYKNKYCLMIMYNIFEICIDFHQISVAERSPQWASDLMIVGLNPSLDFYLFFHSKMRQYLKKSMSDKPERDDRVKLQLINFSKYDKLMLRASMWLNLYDHQAVRRKLKKRIKCLFCVFSPFLSLRCTA